MTTQRITPTPYRLLVKVFALDGFALKRQKGDHLILTKPGWKDPSSSRSVLGKSLLPTLWRICVQLASVANGISNCSIRWKD